MVLLQNLCCSRERDIVLSLFRLHGFVCESLCPEVHVCHSVLHNPSPDGCIMSRFLMAIEGLRAASMAHSHCKCIVKQREYNERLDLAAFLGCNAFLMNLLVCMFSMRCFVPIILCWVSVQSFPGLHCDCGLNVVFGLLKLTCDVHSCQHKRCLTRRRLISACLIANWMSCGIFVTYSLQPIVDIPMWTVETG